MSEVQSLRQTLGSILGMVSTTANGITTTVSMANDAITNLREEQVHKAKVDMVAFKSTYEELAAKQRSLHLKSIQEFRGKSTENAAMYDAALKEIREAIYGQPTA